MNFIYLLFIYFPYLGLGIIFLIFLTVRSSYLTYKILSLDKKIEMGILKTIYRFLYLHKEECFFYIIDNKMESAWGNSLSTRTTKYEDSEFNVLKYFSDYTTYYQYQLIRKGLYEKNLKKNQFYIESKEDFEGSKFIDNEVFLKLLKEELNFELTTSQIITKLKKLEKDLLLINITPYNKFVSFKNQYVQYDISPFGKKILITYLNDQKLVIDKMISNLPKIIDLLKP